MEVLNAGEPLGHLLVFQCPVIKVGEKLQQPNPDHLGMKVKSLFQEKSQDLLKYLLRMEEIQNG